MSEYTPTPTERRFFDWVAQGIAKHVGEEDAPNWSAYYIDRRWDLGDQAIEVMLKRRPDEHVQHSIEVRGRATLTARRHGWYGWFVYQAAGRALRALG